MPKAFFFFPIIPNPLGITGKTIKIILLRCFMLGNTRKVGHSKNKCPSALTQKKLDKLWVLTACNTKVLPASLFSLATYLTGQGVSGSVQTHFGTAHYTLWVILCTFWVLNMHNTTQKVYNGQHQNVFGHHQSILRKRWIGPRAEIEKKKQAVFLYCLC
jgi:hypothetical protein